MAKRRKNSGGPGALGAAGSFPLPLAGRVDLHTHSNASDGTDSPAEVVGKAAALGLRALALTDHDTLAGLDEAEETARATGLEFIRGCEVSSTDELVPGEVHILGLWIPRVDQDQGRELEAWLASLRIKRHERNLLIVEKLRALGLPISYDDVLEYAAASEKDCASRMPRSIGRPHIAGVLREIGVVRDVQEAFTLYLRPGCPAYVPKISCDTLEALARLKKAGALTVLAHPLLIKVHSGDGLKAHLHALAAKLAANGLDAVEVYHSDHSPEGIKQLLPLCRKYSLSPSGGSDYHGAFKPDIALGSGRNNLDIPLEILENLKKRHYGSTP